MTHAASFRGHIIEAIRILLERNVVMTAKADGVNPALYDIASITGGARPCRDCSHPFPACSPQLLSIFGEALIENHRSLTLM